MTERKLTNENLFFRKYAFNLRNVMISMAFMQDYYVIKNMTSIKLSE